MFISALLICSCKKEVIVEIEKKYSWEPSPMFLYEKKIQTTSFANDEVMYSLGINTFSTIRANPDNPDELAAVHSHLYFNYPIERKMPLSAEILVGMETTSLGFYSTRFPFPDGGVNFSMKSIDPLFASFYTPYYSLGTCFGLNELNQCLVPYHIYDTTYAASNTIKYEPSFYFFNLISGFPNLLVERVDTLSCVKINKEDNWGGVIAINAVGKNFFVTCSNKTVRINDEAVPEMSFDGILYRIFEYNNVLYGLSINNLFRSSDNGLNWISVQTIDPDLVNLNFQTIDGKLTGFFKGQLFYFDLTPEGFIAVQEMLNDGIEDDEITSITQFRDRVFVTTFSGVFEKNLEDFFTFKE